MYYHKNLTLKSDGKHSMSEMFNTKTPEITREISKGEYETIYGVNIWSRYDDDSELAQMLWFCKYLNRTGLTTYIDELFYDSKASLCLIKIIDDDGEAHYEIDAIRVIAQLTIEQFELQGVIGHRNPYLSNVLKITI